MANCAEQDQLASEEANWSGSTLFVKKGYIRAAGLGLRSNLSIYFFVTWVYIFPYAANVCILS